MASPIAPTTRTRTLTPAQQGLIKTLMAEHALTAESALNVIMTPAKLARFVGVKLSEEQKAARRFPFTAAQQADFSEDRSIPGTTVQTIRETRNVAKPPLRE